MTQHFTPDEEARLRAQFPVSESDATSQILQLRAFADRASHAAAPHEIVSIREEILLFLDGLGPDDNTYEVLVDPFIENCGLDILIFCNQWLNGHPDQAEPLLLQVQRRLHVRHTAA